jgi:hypothetical protein
MTSIVENLDPTPLQQLTNDTLGGDYVDGILCRFSRNAG